MALKYDHHWKTIMDTMADGLMVVDPQGVIRAVNQAMATMTGYGKQELIGQSCEILCCDACFFERTEGRESYCALFSEGRIIRRKCAMRHKDGKVLHVLKNAATLKDLDGQVIGGVETLTDLHEAISKDRVISSLRRELRQKDSFQGIIGTSAPMRQVFDLISNAAPSDAPIVIYGESGTGKELVAAAIHRLGPRSKGPFVKVNCAALNESLLESELFGHVKGAFTGAERTRIGRFEAAVGGSIFLDEIGDLPLSTQVKLLRVLQEKEIEKVGDQQPVPVDVRVIAATNRDLESLMAQGSFRDDLYYRIGVIPVHLPQLRERAEDIPLLINAFVNRVRLKTGKAITGLDPAALELLRYYRWPGNVRELTNVVEHAFVLCPEGTIRPEHLPRQVRRGKAAAAASQRITTSPGPEDGELKAELLAALEATGGNKSAAARRLGISRVVLYKRLRKFNVAVAKSIRAQ